MQTKQEQIDSLRAEIKDLREGLKYADHGAYGQDCQRIDRLEMQLSELIRCLALIGQHRKKHDKNDYFNRLGGWNEQHETNVLRNTRDASSAFNSNAKTSTRSEGKAS